MNTVNTAGAAAGDIITYWRPAKKDGSPVRCKNGYIVHKAHRWPLLPMYELTTRQMPLASNHSVLIVGLSAC